MLLAVFDLATVGAMEVNKIFYSSYFIERYKRIFDVVKSSSDHPNPYFPFFHLKREGFWHLQVLAGRGAALEKFGSGYHKHGVLHYYIR